MGDSWHPDPWLRVMYLYICCNFLSLIINATVPKVLGMDGVVFKEDSKQKMD
jgi:hypothetical protein